MNTTISLISLNITPKEIRRFHKTTIVTGPDECWDWKNKGERARFDFFRDGIHIKITAARVAYFLDTGIDPVDMYICHRCDNPRCCNPKHLFPGTPADNVHDMLNKGRQVFTAPYRPNPARGDDHYSRRTPEKMPRGDKHGARLHPERLSRGSKHYSTHLTDQDVNQIRLLARAKIPYREIEEQFNISRATVCRIATGQAWKHVPMPAEQLTS